MYVHAIDETHATLLGIFFGPRGADDIGDSLAAFERVHAIGKGQRRGALLVAIVDADWLLPSSRERKLLAARSDAVGMIDSRVIVVTRSAAARWVITAFYWLGKFADSTRAPTVVAEAVPVMLDRVREYRPAAVLAVKRMEHDLRHHLSLRKVG